MRPAVIPSSHTVRVKVTEVYRGTSPDDYGDIEEWASQRLREIRNKYTGLICDDETLEQIKLELDQMLETVAACTGVMPTWTLKVNMVDMNVDIRSDVVEDHAAFLDVLDTGFDASKIPVKDTNNEHHQELSHDDYPQNDQRDVSKARCCRPWRQPRGCRDQAHHLHADA